MTDDKVTVIRIIKYEGTERAVRDAIAKSLALGVKQCGGYTLTISEHLNELLPVDTLSDVVVQATLATAKAASELVDEVAGEFVKEHVENMAIEIYNGWSNQPGWVPWVVNGNAFMQNNARKQARIVLKV